MTKLRALSRVARNYSKWSKSARQRCESVMWCCVRKENIGHGSGNLMLPCWADVAISIRCLRSLTLVCYTNRHVCSVGNRSWVCTYMMRYVEVCELLARAQETYYIMKQLAIFCDKRNEYGERSTTPRSALWCPQVFQPITSFLPWRVGACWIHCRRERILRLCDHYRWQW